MTQAQLTDLDKRLLALSGELNLDAQDTNWEHASYGVCGCSMCRDKNNYLLLKQAVSNIRDHKQWIAKRKSLNTLEEKARLYDLMMSRKTL